MEMMKKMFECMAGKMGEKEKEKWMKQCLTFLEGEGKDKDRERDDKKKEETACPPDRNRVAGCSPEMMEQFLNKMRSCFEERRREGEDGKEKKTEKAKCCL
jgi:hypothetical protein